MSVASHSAIAGSTESLRKVTRALISVSDKTGLVAIGQFLSKLGVEILSTGGSAAELKKAGVNVKEVGEHTGSPEMLNGRVKTLHPKIHGGILAVRGNATHEQDMKNHNIDPIDMVIINLYPFESTVAKGSDFDTCIENIDIGGPAMLRASAKNHQSVVVVTNPNQYESLMNEMQTNSGATTIELRRRFAAAAFALSAHYDGAIAAYFSQSLATEAPSQTRSYTPVLELKYGNNPHQKPASICSVGGKELPFKVLNGTPGYINFLDAANAWQLVKELKEALGLPAAASFKHVSPAGAAVAVPLTAEERKAYEVSGESADNLTPVALAYIRARHADPMCSFGDFAAVSDHVDEATALVLKVEVSDGIVAPSFDAKALEILKAKKNGSFVVLQANPDYVPSDMEFREVFGMGFAQKRNNAKITEANLKEIKTQNKDLSPDAIRDLILASIAVKYTQSNSVGYALNGQMIGVGAGQQSRVDCVKLAGRKVQVWWLRQHPKVQGLKFKAGVKRQDKVNARVRYIEGDMAKVEYTEWSTKFEEVPEPLTQEEKAEFMKQLKGVALSSDAFFPFRDSIDVASDLGVSFIAQPGGSTNDEQVISACNTYGMTMCTGLPRSFHH